MTRLRLPTVLVAAVALGLGACSSSEREDDLPLPGGDAEAASTGDDPYEPPPPPGSDEPSDPGGDSGGTDGGGGDLPTPQPDPSGVDNSPPPWGCDPATGHTQWLHPNDTNASASPVQVRQAVLDDWGGVHAVAIRTWEFFNHYRFDYAAAQPGTLAVHATMMPVASLPGEYWLQLGIASEWQDELDRAAVNLTVVFDTSTSMVGAPMERQQEIGRAIAASLRPGDAISLVTWDDNDPVRLSHHEVAGPDDPIVLDEVDALTAGGTTDLGQGLNAAYAEANTAERGAQRLDRVVFISDGQANVGIDDIELVAAQAEAEGIVLLGAGVGNALEYDDALVDTMTTAGLGPSMFIGNDDDAWAMFHDDFVRTIGVAARDVRVELLLPPGVELAGPELEDTPAAARPQDLAPNDTLVMLHRLRACTDELADGASIEVTVHHRDPVTGAAQQQRATYTVAELLGHDRRPLLKGLAVEHYARSLKNYKRAGLAERDATVDEALTAIDQAQQALAAPDPELAEIRAVLETLADR